MAAPRMTIILDCVEPHILARFWQELLRYDELWRNDTYVVLSDPDEVGPVFALQRVPEQKTSKNRMHIDIHDADLDRAVERVVELGATRLSDAPLTLGEAARWVVMADPEGNEFCIVSP